MSATRSRVVALPGVFRPRSDARLLAAVMSEHDLARNAKALDLFTGSGVLAIAAMHAGARSMTAVDLSRRAVATVRLNALRNGVRVRAVRGDLFAPVAGERFDLIVANPPYLPGVERLPRRGAARAWEGGRDGRELVDRLCDGARDHLAPGGRLLLVQSSLTGEQATLERLALNGLDAELLARRRGPLGPLARGRVEQLRRHGLLDGDADADASQGEEELLVISATYSVHAPARAEEDQPRFRPTRVTPYRDGPYLLRGDFELTDQDGNPIPVGRRTVALCRCGRSQIRPFCDGTHKLVGFRAQSGAERRGGDEADRS